MEVKHCCADCGEVMAVHIHNSWREIKDCLRVHAAVLRAVPIVAGMPFSDTVARAGGEDDGN
jgi:hypothetical protein